MNILFIHQKMPAQFVHLAPTLARDPGNRVVFLTQVGRVPPEGVACEIYRISRKAHESTHHYVRPFEDAVLHGQAVARACINLGQRGFVPDLVVAHPGWGEPMYVKDVFPNTKLINYCEFFYRAIGADVGFDPADVVDTEVAARVRTRNAALMMSLEACDRGFAATEWQRSVHPPEWQSKIEVIFDGIDADRVRPNPTAVFQLQDGTALTRQDCVITYVARDLEPYRGFPNFMRAIPVILEARPEARILIIGGDGVSYGLPPKDGRTWRAVMTEDVQPDTKRVHFLGKLPYEEYLKVLQVSTAHVYLTVPFVLSWSAMEALAAGCVVIGSRTPPVEEILRDGENGFLADFHSPQDIAEQVISAVRHRNELGNIRRRGRETIIGRYDLATCLPRQLDLLRRVTGRDPVAVTERTLTAAGGGT